MQRHKPWPQHMQFDRNSTDHCGTRHSINRLALSRDAALLAQNPIQPTPTTTNWDHLSKYHTGNQDN